MLKQAKLGYETVLNPGCCCRVSAWTKAAKGDFSDRCVSPGICERIGVDRMEGRGRARFEKYFQRQKISDLAKLIKETPGCVTTVVCRIGNEGLQPALRKNADREHSAGVGHARVIENLMGSGIAMNPPPVQAISDQFAASKTRRGKALMSMGGVGVGAAAQSGRRIWRWRRLRFWRGTSL